MTAFKTAKSYSEKARRYEQKWEGYLQNTHHTLLDHFSSSDGHHILDLSSGTGLLAKKITQEEYPFERLVLNDISEGMQKKAVERFSGHPRVQLTSAPAFNLPFSGDEFDSLICLNAFHNYHQKEHCVQEMNRVLKKSGKVYLLDWNNKGWFRPLNSLIKWMVPEFIDTRSSDEVQRMFEQCGFQNQHTVEWRYRYWKLFLSILEKTEDAGA